MTEGIILKGIGGFYYVDTADGLIECKARGRFRKTVGKPIVGDRVTLEIQSEDGTGYLLDIAPRKNSLVRPAVANLDLLVAVASAAPPVTDPFLIDRVTAIAVHKDMDVLVVNNKTDENPGDELYETYRKSGIDTLRVSARPGDGIDELKVEEPEIMKQGGRYGVKLKAQAPSIHMIKCNTYTEVAPIVGSESQSQELVMYLLKEFEENPNKIWETDIFGKSLHELVNEGLRGKLERMPDDARSKFRETIERVINEGCSGLICIIL